MIDALALVRDFSALQERLVCAFFLVAAPPDDAATVGATNGRLVLEGDDWKYIGHGGGVRFVCSDGRVVDAHFGMKEHPRGITAWRLLQYLESIGIDDVRVEGFTFSTAEEEDLERLLARLSDMGFVRRVPGHIYEPVSPREP